MYLPGDHVGHGRAAAAVRDMGDVEAGCDIEQSASEMGRGAHAGRAVLHLGSVRLPIGDELLQAVGGEILACDQHHRLLDEQSDRREIGDGIVRQLLVERGVIGVGADGAEQEHLAIRGSARHAVGANDAGRRADVLDDYLLVQDLAQPRREHPSDHVERAARGKRHHHGHWPGRPLLRRCPGRGGRKRGDGDDDSQSEHGHSP